MGTRLTVFNQKGGVGKTTTVLNLGAALAQRGQVPLLVDVDAQSHLSSILNPGAPSGESLFAYYNAGKPLKEVVRPIRFGGELIPGHTELIKVDALFGKGPDILNKLKQGLDAGWNGTRPVLIDCCPMLGVLSLSGIFASERVLIPISTDYLALRGALALEKTLKALEHVLKRRVARRYLLTRFDSRRRMSHDIAEQLASRFGAELCETRITEAVSIAESPALGKDVFSHAPASRGAQDYASLLEELLTSGFLEIQEPGAPGAPGSTC
ncbi:MAG TPA: ParA family protein [Burkholderiales bacterium]|nr:ParA family protein [Burkholderiales bacterium]